MKGFNLKDVKDSLVFLRNHPALNEASRDFFGQIMFDIEAVCKNGISENILFDGHITIDVEHPSFLNMMPKYSSPEDFENVFSLCDSDHFRVPYKEIYGEEWKLERYRYFCHYLILDLTNSGGSTAYDGGYIISDNYEEMVVGCAKDVKKKYGNWHIDDFVEDSSWKHIDELYEKANKMWWEWFSQTEHCKEFLRRRYRGGK